MSLLIFMYHRARAEQHGNAASVLDAHFAHIAACCRHVLPGETLATGRLNVCLSFDDAYFDFYDVVFPLLQKHGLRALLAVPPFVMREQVHAPSVERRGIASETAFNHPSRGGFCTWEELETMAASGHVAFAAHGFSHLPLDRAATDFSTEIDTPKTLLSTRLRQPIESFVFPFGRFSARALHHARSRYRYIFRIGGALNRSWSAELLYRINADGMSGPRALFSPARLASYRARYFWNRLRFR